MGNFNKKYVFMGLSVALTLISLQVGFKLYSTFFGLSVAILIAATIELLRLSSLYSIKKFTPGYKIIAITLYTLVAVISFTVAVISFNSDVVNDDLDRVGLLESNMLKDSNIIKTEYSKLIDTQISDINKKLSIVEKKNTAWVSKTYKRRIELYNKQINDLINKRSIFLDTKPSKDWINSQKAILGIRDITGIYKNSEYNAIEKATTAFLGVDHLLFQKMIGVVLATMVEFGIILLAIIAVSFDEPEDYTKPKKELNMFRFKKKVKDEKVSSDSKVLKSRKLI